MSHTQYSRMLMTRALFMLCLRVGWKDITLILPFPSDSWPLKHLTDLLFLIGLRFVTKPCTTASELSLASETSQSYSFLLQTIFVLNLLHQHYHYQHNKSAKALTNNIWLGCSREMKAHGKRGVCSCAVVTRTHVCMSEAKMDEVYCIMMQLIGSTH